MAMNQCSSCCYLCQVALIFMTFLSILSSSTSSSTLSLQSKTIYVNCVIENKTANLYDYFIRLDFPHQVNQVNLNISQEKFWMEAYNSYQANYSCAIWEAKNIYNFCSRVNTSNKVLCLIRKIDAQKSVNDTYQYALFAKYNSTNTSCFYIGYINSLTCECKNFRFDANLYISRYPLVGKADVSMTPFSEAKSHVKDFDMAITPNESLIINKSNISNTFMYRVSKLDLCQTYSVNAVFQLDQSSFKRKCQNDWKMNPGIIEFEIPKLDISWLNCSHNQTHLYLASTPLLNSNFYYNVTIEGKSFIKSFSSKMSFPLPMMNKHFISNELVGLASLCFTNCRKCGTKELIRCHSETYNFGNLTDNFFIEKPSSSSMVIIFSIVVVGLFLAIIGVTIWTKKKMKSLYSGSGGILPRRKYLKSNLLLSNFRESDTVEPANVEPNYEEIKDYHFYDKPETN